MAVTRLRYPPIDLGAVAAAITIDTCLVPTKTCMICSASPSTSHTTTIELFNVAHEHMVGGTTLRLTIKPPKSLVFPIVHITTILLQIILLNL